MSASATAFAQTAGEEPIITFKTNIYEQYGAANAFHIVIGSDSETDYLDIDAGLGAVSAEIEPWSVDNTGITGGTAIPLNVSADGIVKIYGDPKLVNYFDAEGCYIDWIELSACTNIEVINLSHNELKGLDLSAQTKLFLAELSDNTFSAASPLKLGSNHPELTVLDIAMTGWIDPSINFSDYPKLASLSAYSSQTLTSVNTTGCPNLQRLSIDVTPVETVDVTKNPRLAVLNISDTKITSIDLSNNPKLSEFYASHVSGFVNQGYRLEHFDLSNLPELKVLSLAGNGIKSIDLSKNPMLFDLNLSRNLLTDIDFSNNPDLYNLNLSFNNLSFANLPIPTNSMGQFLFHEYYYMLNPIELPRAMKSGETIDVSDKVLREGTTTTVTVYSQDLTRTGEGESVFQPVENPEELYNYADGKITFLKAMPDSLYVAFNNDVFTEAAYRTSCFMVKSAADFGQPSEILTFATETGTEVKLGIGIDGATAQEPATFMVDFGDGTPVQFTATGQDIPASPNVAGKSAGNGLVRILIPEGKVMAAFSADGVKMTSINLTAARELRQLTVANAGLYSIDISYNRNLRSLNLSGNLLSELDFHGVNGEYEKYMLSDINISNNKLSALDLVAHQPIRRLDISHNEFTDFSSKDWDNLVYADLSYNKFTELSLVYFTSVTDLDISNNDIAALTMPETNVFEHFDCSSNDLAFPALPMLQALGAEFVYAPQQNMRIPSEGAGAHLTSQNLTVDGKSTVYTWKLASDNSTVGASDITTTDGIANFLNPDLGKVYCEITHPLFPALTILTTEIKTASKPDRMIAKFRTPVGGETVSLSLAGAKNGSAIYINWDGSGAVFEPYQLRTQYTLFSATTVENAEVTVWTYGNSTDVTVFSIDGATMENFDGSGLDKCFCLTLAGAGLEDNNIIFPPKENITELNLNGNKLTKFDLSEFPNVWMLSLDNNNLETLTAKNQPNIVQLSASHNRLTSVDLDLPNLSVLSLASNRLRELDLSKLPGLNQLQLSSNSLSSIDLSANPNIVGLAIDRNNFTFATLPVPKQGWVYLYANQNPVEAECVDGKVDLSSQAKVGTTETKYQWFIGVPEFDETNNLVGEELVADEEYTLDNGVTTFTFDPEAEVMCVMTNSVFDKLYLYTNLLTVQLSGIESVIADLGATVSCENGTITVSTSGSADGTAVKLYTVSGALAGSAAIHGGSARIDGVAAGAYVLSVGTKAVKVVVK